MPTASKRLVIDASVARASGGAEATYPTSKHCRDFLQAVLKICHQLVLTPDITAEWKRHRSKFAQRWLVSMFARKKVYRLAPESNDDLLTKIQATQESEKSRAALLKDIRLVEAAMAADQTIVSLDETVRQLLTVAAQQVGELHQIIWVNPGHPQENPINWLKTGAQNEPTRRLRKR